MSLSVRSVALAVLLVAAGLAASLAGIIIGEGQRIHAAKLAGSVVLALALAGAYFAVRGRRDAPAGHSIGPVVLLAIDGVALTLVAVAIAQMDDAPGAALIGFVVLLINLTAAFFAIRRARRLAGEAGSLAAPGPGRGLAALIGFNGVMLMLAFWMLGAFLDPPGAPGIGALFLAANLIAAINVARRR